MSGLPTLSRVVTVGSMGPDPTRAARGALAGVAAAGVWAALQPLDKRLFRSAYDDVELLGKSVTRGSGWYPIGLAMHLANGAVFGAAYASVAHRVPIPAWARGPAAAMIENFGFWPLTPLTDRLHPARGELPQLSGNRNALAQATFRHLVFGIVLGELERRLNREQEDAPGVYDGVVSPNGYGRIEHAVAEPRS